MANRLTYPLFKAFTQSGALGAGYKLYSYEAGTTTPKSLYQDVGATTAHDNPVVLSSLGENEIFVDGPTKLDLTDENGVSQPGWPIDDVEGYSYGSTGSAKTSDYTLTASDLDGSMTFTNDGATGTVTLTLPAGVDGARVCFYVAEAELLLIQADGDDRFRWGGEVSATGGYISSDDVGTHVEIFWSGDEWAIISLAGDWNYLLSGQTNEGTWSHTPVSTDELGLELEWVSATSFKVTEGLITDSGGDHVLQLSSAMTKTLSAFATGTGNGSLEGSLTGDLFVSVYLIKNTTTGAVDIAIEENTTTLSSYPTGFDVQRWLGTLYIDSGSEIPEFEFTKANPHIITYTDTIQIASLSGATAQSTAVTVSKYFPTSLTTKIVNVGVYENGATCSTVSGQPSCSFYFVTYAKVTSTSQDCTMPDGGLWSGTQITCSYVVREASTTAASCTYDFKMITFNR